MLVGGFKCCKVSITMSKIFERQAIMLFRNVPDECKTQGMGERVALEDPGTL